MASASEPRPASFGNPGGGRVVFIGVVVHPESSNARGKFDRFFGLSAANSPLELRFVRLTLSGERR